MEIMAFMAAAFGFIFGLSALSRVNSLEKKLKELGVIPRDFDSEKTITRGD